VLGPLSTQPGDQGAVRLILVVNRTGHRGQHCSISRELHVGAAEGDGGLGGMSVVDSRLKVYGVDRLRIADASVMPRVPLANTMAPSVIIGEQASRAIARERGTR
jgi:hypothetical protein